MVAIVSGNSLGLSSTSLATLGQRGALGSSAQGRSGEQAYVNLSNGNLVIQRRDEYLKSVGPDAYVLRTYNSQGQFNDDNGDNWAVGAYTQPLKLTGTVNTAGSTLARTAGDAAQTAYAFDVARNLYVSTDGAGAYNSIRFDSAASQFVWTEGSTGLTERYGNTPAGKLLSRTDSNGNTSSYGYNAAGLILSATSASGEVSYYDYTGNNLTQIRVVALGGATSTRVRYSYDTSNRLAQVTVDLSPYDNSIADGKTYITGYTYDGSSKRIASVAQSDGTGLSISYVQTGAEYRVATITDALGQITRYNYILSENRTNVTDPKGIISSYICDVQGQLTNCYTGVSSGRPFGLAQMLYSYNVRGDVTAITDGLGHSVTFQYDASGNQVLKTDALGNTVSSTFNAKNQLLTDTASDSNGSGQVLTTRYVYDSAGKNLQRFAISAEGRVTECRYNAIGLCSERISYTIGSYSLAGLGVTDVPTESQLTAWAATQDLSRTLRSDMVYDFRGQLSSRTNYGSISPTGVVSDTAVTQYFYSQAGELVKTIEPNTSSVSQYVYDGLGRILLSSVPATDGSTVSTTVSAYNEALKTVSVTIANGLATLSTYDAAGRLVSVMQSSGESNLGTTLYSYDANDRLIMTEDPTGVRQWVVYDDAGRKVAEVDGTGAAVEYVYNANNQVTQTIAYANSIGVAAAPTLTLIRASSSSADRNAWRIYDKAERLVWQIDVQGYVTQTDYDNASRIVAITRLVTPINTSVLGGAESLIVDNSALVLSGAPNLSPTATFLQISQASPAAGASITLTANVLGTNPQGTVTFYNDGVLLGTASLVNGGANLVVGSLAAGQKGLCAKYEGSASSAGSASAIVPAYVLTQSTVSVTSTNGVVVQDAGISLVANVSGSNPTGTVTFLDGSTVLGSANVRTLLGFASAVLSLDSLGIGSHSITALFSGDTGNSSAISTTGFALKVIARSSIVLTSGGAQSAVGTPVTLTATVGTPAGQPQAGGTVSFYNGTTLLGSGSLTSGVASLTVANLPLGAGLISAVYAGDSNASASTSATLNQVVLPAVATTSVLMPSSIQLAPGSALTLNVKVTPVATGGGTLDGLVTFFDGIAAIGSSAVINGVATLTVSSIAAGNHSYRATYSGDSDDAGSVTATVTVASSGVGTAGTAGSTTALSASVNSIVQGNPVTFTANVTSVSGAGVNTGTVTFVSAGLTLGTANVVSGVATLVSGSLGVGTNSVQASYSGDVNNPGNISTTPVSVAVAAAVPVFTLGSSMASVVKNTPVTLTAKLVGSNAALPPTGSVTFYSGVTALGSATLSNGLAALSVSTLAVGANSITVQYAGDANNAAGTSAVFTQSLTPQAAGVAISTSSASVAAGGLVTLTANLASGVNLSTTGVSVSGTTATTTAGGWASSLRSTLGSTGGASMSFVPQEYSSYMIGLNTDPMTDDSYTSLDWALYCASGNLYVFQNGGNLGSFGTYAIGDTLSVSYDGSAVRYLRNGSVVYQQAATIIQPLYLDSSFLVVGTTISNLQFKNAAGQNILISTGPTPTGTVTFFNGQSAVGTASAVNGVASLATTQLNTVGTASITAVYTGDAYNATATSSATTITVTAAASTSGTGTPVTITSSNSSVLAGSQATFNATVISGEVNAASVNLAGASLSGSTVTSTTGSWASSVRSTVSSTGGAGVSVVIPPASGVFVFGLNTDPTTDNSYSSIDWGLWAGDGSLWSCENGAWVYLSTSTVGDALSVVYDGTYIRYLKSGTVLRQVAASITQPLYLDSSFASAGNSFSSLQFKNGSGQSLITGSAPTGTVTFYNEQTSLGTATLTNGVATLATSLLSTGGTARVTGRYNGDSSYAVGTSAVLIQTVTLPTTTTTLSASAASATRADAVTLTATITGGTSGITPTGTVTFLNGTTVLGAVNLVNGVAIFSAIGLPLGANSIKAVYSGDTKAATSASAVVTETTAKANATIALSSSISSRTASTATVVLTARVTGASLAGAPTGTFTFYNNGSAISGPVTITNGLASFSAALSIGQASFTALYSGDADNVGLAPSALAVNLRGTSTVTTQLPSLTTSAYGVPITLSASTSFNPSSPGTISFYSGTVLLGMAVVQSNGMATLVTSQMPVGANPITAVFSGNTNMEPSSSASVYTVTVAGAATNLALAVSRSQIALGSSLTLNATITAAGLTSGIGGTVTFYRGSIAVGTATAVNGVATLTLANLPLGASQFTATYGGAASFVSSTSAAASIAVFAAPTSTTLSASPANASPGTQVTLTAQISGVNPSGTVTFTNGSSQLGTAAVANGIAILVIANLPNGSSTLQAKYGGDTNNTSSISGGVLERVVPLQAPSLSCTSPATAAQNGLIAITVGGTNPTGTVTLLRNNTVIATAAVINGVAQLAALQLPTGTSNLTASYSGDIQNGSGVFQFSRVITTSLAATAIVLTNTVARTQQGFSNTLSAHVAGKDPTGSVTFFSGTSALGTLSLINGMGALTLNDPLPQMTNLTAVYSGDSTNATGTSAALDASANNPVLSLTRSTNDRTLQEIYDQDGLLRATIDSEGYLTEFRYNAADQLTSGTQYASRVPNFTGQASIATRIVTARKTGNLAGLLPSNAVADIITLSIYNTRGQLVGDIDAERYLTERIYDTNGNLTQSVRYATQVSAASIVANATLAAVRPIANVNDQVTLQQWNAANRLVQSTNHEGTVTQYQYNNVGNLIKTTLAANTAEVRSLSVRYDAQGRLTGELTAEGNVALSALLTLSPTQLQIDTLWAQQGLTHAYDAAGRRISTIDQNVNKTLYFYDADSRLTHTLNALGEITITAYNAFGQIKESTRLSERFSLAGLNGGLISTALQQQVATKANVSRDSKDSYTYTNTGWVETITDATSTSLTITDNSDQGKVENTYNAFGEIINQRVSNVGSGSVNRTNRYDFRGYVIESVTDAGTTGIKATQTTELDAFGRVYRTLDANGNQRTVIYDRLGRTVSRTDPLNVICSTSYDSFSRVLTQTDGLNQTTQYAYDKVQRSVAITTPESITVTTARTRLGQTLSVTDGNGNITRFEYDKNGNETAVATPLTRSTNVYDRANRLIQSTDANGNLVQITYDAANRVVTRAVDPLGLNLVTAYSYSAKGEQLTVTDPKGYATKYTYNVKGELINQIVDPSRAGDGYVGLNLVTQYSYDGAGNMLTVVDPNGTTTTYTYDKLSRRVLEVVDPSTPTHSGLNLTRRYSYDKADNLISVTDANQHITRYAYDAGNRQRFALDGAGNLSEMVYDALGRVVRRTAYAKTVDSIVFNGLGLAVSEAAMQGAGMRQITPLEDQVENRVYDRDGRLAATVNGIGDVVKFSYDKNGNVLLRTAFANRVVGWAAGTVPSPASDATDQSARTVYDALNRARYTIDGTGAVVSQRYDASGNVLERTAFASRLDLVAQPIGVTAGIPDLDGRVSTIANSAKDNKVTFVYDANNRLSTSSNAAGQATQYLYDANGNSVQQTLFAAIRADDQFSRKQYDAANRLIQTVDATGAVTQLSYDKNGNLTKQTQLATPLAASYLASASGNQLVTVPTPTYSFGNDRVSRYLFDRANRQSYVVDAEGAITETQLDGVGNVTQTKQSLAPISAAMLVQLDAALAQQGSLDRAAVDAFITASPAQDRVTRNYYDAAGQLRLTRDSLQNLKGFTYDGVGRLKATTVYSSTQSADYWLDEGVAGYVSTTSTSGNTPLFRLSNTSNSDHVYTTNASERSSLLLAGWVDEGNSGFIDTTPSSATTAFYRLSRVGTTNHLYTTNVAYKNWTLSQGGWADEGTIGFIAIAPDVGSTALFQLSQQGTTARFYGDLRLEVDKALTPVPVTSPGDNTDTFTYNAAGELISSKDALLQTETYTYDGVGRKAAFSNKLGSVWTYGYDSAGHLTRETSPQVSLHALGAGDGTSVLGSVVTVNSYDARGNVIERTEAAGRPEARTTKYEYDTLDRQVKTIYPEVGVYTETLANLTTNGNGATATRTDISQALWTQTTYDALGNAVASRDTAGNWRYKAYDKAGRVAFDVDALGYVTAYTRNAFGDSTTMVRYAEKRTNTSANPKAAELSGDMGDSTQHPQDRDLISTYDRVGRVLMVMQPLVSNYDSRTTGVASNGRNTKVNTYNAFGDLLRVADMRNAGTNEWLTTHHFYDQLGQRTATIDAAGYLTKQSFDAIGNLVGRTEYATLQTSTFWTTDTSTSAILNRPRFTVVVNASKDRTISYGYDKLNRKVSEVRQQVPYTATDAISLATLTNIDNVTSSDPLATTYAYDAVGNLTATTDAAGGTTYSRYDAMGRVTTVVAPVRILAGQGATPMAPVTEFMRDAYGNAVLTIERADGVSASSAASGLTATGNLQDRKTFAVYDRTGHATQTTDAQGVQHLSSYNQMGLLAKAWQSVTSSSAVGQATTRTIFTAYQYDALGRQTHVYTPVSAGNSSSFVLSAAPVLADTEQEYNAFGEVTKKSIRQNGVLLAGSEIFEYDQAGRVWRTRSTVTTDGITTLYYHDLQGNQTARIRNANSDLTLFTPEGALLSKDILQTTEQKFDRLGRVTETIDPKRTTTTVQPITTRDNIVFATISQKANTPVQLGIPAAAKANRVDFTWRSLQDLGSGDIRINLSYLTSSYDYVVVNEASGTSFPYTSAPVASSKSVIVTAEEASVGYSMIWNDPSLVAGSAIGISSISAITVEKKDVAGNWVKLYDVANLSPISLTRTWAASPSGTGQAGDLGFIWTDPAPGRVAVYRNYNQFTGSHFFTTSAYERDLALNHLTGWLDEGIIGYVSSNGGVGLTALYRLNYPGTDKHIFTTSSAEVTAKLGQGWVKTGTNGIDGYVSTNKTSDNTKLIHLNKNVGETDNLYLSNTGERDALLGLTTEPASSSSQFYGGLEGLSIEVGLPLDLVSTTTLQYRRAGTTSWTSVPVGNIASFNGAYRFDVGSIPNMQNGGYDYQVINTNSVSTTTVGSGTFSVGATVETFPRITSVAQGSALIDGVSHPVLKWATPSATTAVTFRFKPTGSSAWQTWFPGNSVFGSDRTNLPGQQCIALDNLPIGTCDYELRFIETAITPGNLTNTTQSTGTLAIKPGVGLQNTTPASPISNNNSQNLGVEGYLWTSYAAGRLPLHRFYLAYGNDHHVLTCDSGLIGYLSSLSTDFVIAEGIVGYVDAAPNATNKRLYSLNYGDRNVYRVTTDASVAASAIVRAYDGAPQQPGYWQWNSYQVDGYLSTTPVTGTVALYSVYDGNSYGNQGLGDYLSTTVASEVNYLMSTNSNATATVAGVTTGKGTVDGTEYSVLQWPAPEAGSRTTVTSYPGIPAFGATPSVFNTGGGKQGIVLQYLSAGQSYAVSIVVEYPATGAHSAYVARTDINITVPAGGVGDPVWVDTTAAYLPQTRVVNNTTDASQNAVVKRTVDRWGNVTEITDPRAGNDWLTNYDYNANNQLIKQTQKIDFPGTIAETKVYYDKLGRQVGVKDANGNVNVQTYDVAGNLSQERHADGGLTDYAYNAFGDKVQSSVKMKDVDLLGGARTIITDYTYDKLSRLKTTSLVQGITAYTAALGSNSSITAPANLNPVGALATDTANGATITSTVQTQVQSTTYDEAGRKIKVTNGNSETTDYAYDLAGNVILSGQYTVANPSSFPYFAPRNTTQYSYDALNRKTSETDANGNTQTWTYTQQGRLTGHTDFGLNAAAAGQLQSTYAVTYNYAYDWAGLLTHQGNNAPLSQNLDYRYDNAGQLTQISDKFLGQTSQYTYDLAGNRLSEKVSQKTLLPGATAVSDVVYQDNHMAYDSLGRLLRAFDGRADVVISYDKVGNRISTKSNVYGVMDGSVAHTETTTYTYDGMNRQLTGGGHTYAYDKIGNRVKDTFDGHSDILTYDDLNRVVSVNRDGFADYEQRKYDGAGQLVFSKSFVDGQPSTQYRYNAYDNGQLSATRAVLRKAAGNVAIQMDDISYSSYDARGNLLAYQVRTETEPTVGPHENHIVTQTSNTFSYAHQGSYQQTRQDVQRNAYPTQAAASQSTASTSTYYDANGFISNTVQVQSGAVNTPFNRAFVNDAQGHALYVNQGAAAGDANNIGVSGAVSGRLQNQSGGYLGGWIGNASTNPGQVQRQMVVNGETLARFGMAADTPAASGQAPVFTNVAELYLKADASALPGSSAQPAMHTVVRGETLQSIARATLGDSRLWYRIAEVNGLSVSGTASLQAGLTLSIPKTTLSANNTSTFKPYDPGKTIGDSNPALEGLPMPSGQGGDGCGGLGQIIMLAIVIAVTVYSAGALAASGALGANALGAATLAGATTGGGVGATFAAGSTVLGGGAGLGAAIGAGVLSSTLGSVAGQAFGIASGMQRDFNWQSVALSALSGGVGGGLGALANGAGALSGNTWGMTMARAAIGNALTQGIAVVTGLQPSFNWASVAASAIGAGVGQAVGYGMNSALGSADLHPLAQRTLTGLAAGTATALARGGRVEIQQIATDAFGNALGQSFVDAMQPTQRVGAYSAADYRNGSDIQSDNAAWDRHVAAASTGGGVWDDAPPPSMADRYAQVYGGEVTQTGDRLNLSRGRMDDLDQQIRDAKGVLNMLDRRDAAGVSWSNQQNDNLSISDSDLASMRQENLARMQSLAAQTAIDSYRGSGDRSWTDANGMFHVEISGVGQSGAATSAETLIGDAARAAQYGSMTPIGETEGFFTFNPIGQGIKGVGTAAFDAWTALPNALRGVGTLAGDAYGYASQAVAPRRSVLTGQPFEYQPQSALLQSVQQQGVLGTVGAGITGAVRNAPGIGLIGALGAPSRNWGNVGAQAFNTGTAMLGAAGTMRGQSVAANTPAVWGKNPAFFTTETTWTAPGRGTGLQYKVYQQEIDWTLEVKGVANLERAQAGQAPYVLKNGEAQQVQLHHSRQNAEGPLFELSRSTHLETKAGQGREAVHPYGRQQHPDFPVDRSLFKIEVPQYWRDRAAGAQR